MLGDDTFLLKSKPQLSHLTQLLFCSGAAAAEMENLSPAPWLGWACPGSSLGSHKYLIIHAKWSIVLQQTAPKADVHREGGKLIQNHTPWNCCYHLKKKHIEITFVDTVSFENRTEVTIMLECIEQFFFLIQVYFFQKILCAYIFTGLSSGVIKLSQRVNHILASGILLLSSVPIYPFP